MGFPLHHMSDKELVRHTDNLREPTPLERELAARLDRLLELRALDVAKTTPWSTSRQ